MVLKQGDALESDASILHVQMAESHSGSSKSESFQVEAYIIFIQTLKHLFTKENLCKPYLVIFILP